MRYWLMKSEPDCFSINDLQNRPNQIEPWDGVRNYQARNMLRDDAQVGDKVFFYHSNCDLPGIVGIAEIVKAGYPDSTAFDPEHEHFDTDSDPAKPRWYRVDVKFVKAFRRTISLKELQDAAMSNPHILDDWALLKKGNRLSVMPVSQAQWDFVLSLA